MLSIVEAAYAVDAPAQTWTGGLLEAADRSISSGLGGFACGFRGNVDGTISIDVPSASVANLAPEMAKAIFDGLTRAPPGWLSSYTSNPRSASYCVMTSEVDPSFRLSYRARLARNGIHDGINIACMDLDGRGVLISLGVGVGRKLTAPIRRDLARVGTHIAAALRLRGRVRGADVPVPGSLRSLGEGGAVLSADGNLLHAEGEAKLASARRALEKAVCDIESARTFLRGNVERALRLWRGLVSARWSLVDEFDSHGAKYIVARENLPVATPMSKLTPTERCVVTCALRGFSTKEIAYTLGISDSTVRVLIMRAVRRYGYRSRHELMKLGVAESTRD
jgi:DNA-binding CsgD family transcriptional regulator